MINDKDVIILLKQNKTCRKIGELLGCSHSNIEQRKNKYIKFFGSIEKFENMDVEEILSAFSNSVAGRPKLSEEENKNRIDSKEIEKIEFFRKMEERKNYFKNNLIKKIRYIAGEVGHTPLQREMKQYGLNSMSIYQTFGSVEKGMREAGLIPNKNHAAHTGPSKLPDDFYNE